MVELAYSAASLRIGIAYHLTMNGNCVRFRGRTALLKMSVPRWVEIGVGRLLDVALAPYKIPGSPEGRGPLVLLAGFSRKTGKN